MKKFVSRKSRKYELQGNRLLLPDLEILFVFSVYENMSLVQLEKALKKVNDTLDRLNRIEETKQYVTFYDDICLCYFLKGTMLFEMYKITKNISVSSESEQIFKIFFALCSRITHDHWMDPFGHYQLARLYIALHKLDDARIELTAVQNTTHEKYSMQGNLQARVQLCLEQCKSNE
jgi:hypothetical protein